MNGTGNILLVDDNPIDNYISVAVIRKSGFSGELKAVESGRDALNYLAVAASGAYPVPDYIFLDQFLTDMEATDFVRAFDEDYHPVIPECKIIILSALNKIITSEYSKKYVLDFMEKPLTVDAFRNIIPTANTSISIC